MKTLIISIIAALSIISIASADERVRGYWRDSDGDGYKEKWVDPYYRTNRDNNLFNNYSTQGNTNPWTGERGYKNPYIQDNYGGYGNNRSRSRSRW